MTLASLCWTLFETSKTNFLVKTLISCFDLILDPRAFYQDPVPVPRCVAAEVIRAAPVSETDGGNIESTGLYLCQGVPRGVRVPPWGVCTGSRDSKVSYMCEQCNDSARKWIHVNML